MRAACELPFLKSLVLATTNLDWMYLLTDAGPNLKTWMYKRFIVRINTPLLPHEGLAAQETGC